jgi:hypothetical protein
MIHFSDAYGVAQPISKFKEVLKNLGPKGSFTWAVPGKKDAVIKVSDSASVKVTFPLKIDYEITADNLILNFSQPYPIGSYSIFNKSNPRLSTVSAALKLNS